MRLEGQTDRTKILEGGHGAPKLLVIFHKDRVFPQLVISPRFSILRHRHHGYGQSDAIPISKTCVCRMRSSRHSGDLIQICLQRQL